MLLQQPCLNKTHRLYVSKIEKVEVKNTVKEWIKEHGVPTSIRVQMEMIKWIKALGFASLVEFGSGLQPGEILIIQ